jgi:hypothetical protein
MAMARSSNAANFSSLLQCEHGMGVRPATYSLTKFETTVSSKRDSKFRM